MKTAPVQLFSDPAGVWMRVESPFGCKSAINLCRLDGPVVRAAFQDWATMYLTDNAPIFMEINTKIAEFAAHAKRRPKDLFMGYYAAARLHDAVGSAERSVMLKHIYGLCIEIVPTLLPNEIIVA